MTPIGDRYVGVPPKNLSAIEQRVRNLAADTGTPSARLRHRLAVEVLADAIASVVPVDGEDKFAIKGGSALMLRLGIDRSRFSKDLDAMLRGSLTAFLDRLRELGRTGHLGWNFTLVREQEIALPASPVRPRRVAVKMAYGGKPYATVTLEVSPEEAGAADSTDLVPVVALRDVGFVTQAEGFLILGVKYQVAQKLHACTERRSGFRNDRAHDLVDIALLAELVRADLPAVKAACLSIFATRAMHSWPPVVEPEPHWPALYTTAARDLEGVVPSDVTAAAELVNALIREVDAAPDLA
ncbi:nucleotidyl transferase AbiEii/AbiGii toxin family protein [Actinotalea sp. M2MS4P-6]|uniref:nucleotidyl transferase AbiEii/AbiGii toxin family protein n=1 Tax=Actinotalea sp. M2MS4P-6 TaxID=2983762 RepID=UPI0021E45521|nr:nucleotidyl transferase AbiEii/AbiGii toxin family protein [Actinotalea sp. M2MS4P-6]MCV2396263.1 nucleotidyl transferase AbiEii/AbiGii toxin family protein [Actinotalea sp. M2MS4P-6]